MYHPMPRESERPAWRRVVFAFSQNAFISDVEPVCALPVCVLSHSTGRHADRRSEFLYFPHMHALHAYEICFADEELTIPSEGRVEARFHDVRVPELYALHI